MERSGSDLGNRYIFSPKSSRPVIDEATLNLMGRGESYRFSSQEKKIDSKGKVQDFNSFRNASDSFFKNQSGTRFALNTKQKQQYVNMSNMN